MPVLNALQQRRLAASLYAMDQRPEGDKRDGYPVPGTGHGNIYDNACWNWALMAGLGTVASPMSAVSIWEDIIDMDILHEPVVMVGIKDVNVDVDFPGSQADFDILEGVWEEARDGSGHQRRAFKRAMLRIAARKNGLTPAGLDGIYTLHMKTGADEWYGWHHMGIGIKLQHQGIQRQTIVQTVPQTDVFHCCSTMWDENLQETKIGITGLVQEHINILDRVRAPIQCCVCAAVPHGFYRPRQGWHQCDTCLAVYCQLHKALLLETVHKTFLNPHTTRRCNRAACHGHTTII